VFGLVDDGVVGGDGGESWAQQGTDVWARPSDGLYEEIRHRLKIGHDWP